MLQRDKYKPDSIQQYLPNYSLEKYHEYISGAKPFYRMFFDENQRQRWDSTFNTTNNIIFSVFLFSLLPVLFHTKLPVLKRFTSKKSRVFWGLGLIFVPANIVGALIGRSTQTQVMASYNVTLPEFKRYRENKDLLEINPNIKLSEY